MPFDADQARTIQNHLAGRSLVCPVCASKQWQLLVEVLAVPVHSARLFTNPKIQDALRSIEAKRKSTEPGPAFTSGKGLMGEVEKTFPVAVVACVECFYVMQFAWKPIVDKVGAGG
jgi:hypothetical protein